MHKRNRRAAQRGQGRLVPLRCPRPADIGRYHLLDRFRWDIELSCLTYERIENGVKRARAKLFVEALGERLEIDIGGVHRGEELWSRKLPDVARGHRDRLQPDFP